MSIKIHHGPPGSYKTAGAIKDDLIPVLKTGRTVVTNVRGVTADRINEAFPSLETPYEDGVNLIYLDTRTSAVRAKLANWFHWVPLGAFMIFDEAQSIFPKRWKEADIKKLDYPPRDGLSSYDTAAQDGRPATWEDAWDMHRHYNWDIMLTTPDITKIRTDIREAGEGAYKHKNLGLYGFLFKGSYIEGFHLKDNDGAYAGNFQSVTKKRIKKDDVTWKIYDSTATGQISDTKAGINFLLSPRLLIPVVVAAMAIGFVFRNGVPHLLPSHTNNQVAAATVPAPIQTVPVPTAPNPPATVRADNDFNADGKVNKVHSIVEHPFMNATVIYSGQITNPKTRKEIYLFTISNGQGTFTQTSIDLEQLGYRVQTATTCAAVLVFNNRPIFTSCETAYPDRQNNNNPQKPQNLAAAAS